MYSILLIYIKKIKTCYLILEVLGILADFMIS